MSFSATGFELDSFEEIYFRMEEELRCPKCNSSQTRFRVKTKDHICYVCGNTWKMEDKE